MNSIEINLDRIVADPAGRYGRGSYGRRSGIRKAKRNSRRKKNKDEPAFVNLRSDFGFKRVFGDTNGKADLIRMLNSFIKDPDSKIKDLVFQNSEIQGATKENRKVLYDIFCTDNLGRNFVIEMQNYYLEHLLKRMVLYLSVALVDSAKKGSGWDYSLSPFTGVLFSSFNVDEENLSDYIKNIGMYDAETMMKCVDSLNIRVVELDKFNQTIDELETEQDVFIFLLKNMETLDEFPISLDYDLYGPLFERARIANFNKKERIMFDLAVLAEDKHQAEIESGISLGKKVGIKVGIKEGIKEGVEETKKLLVKNLLQSGRFSMEEIAEYTELTPAEILQIKDKLPPNAR